MRGLLIGFLAFVAGFLLTRHFVLLGPLPATEYNANEFSMAGWYFYNAHFVPLSETASLFGETATATGFDLIEADETSDYLRFLYVLPPITLFIAGVLSAVGYGKTYTISFAALNGASIVVGYLLAVIIGLFFFSESVVVLAASGTMRPSIGHAIIVAGIAYPAIFGALGGIAYFVSQGSMRISVG